MVLLQHFGVPILVNFVESGVVVELRARWDDRSSPIHGSPVWGGGRQWFPHGTVEDHGGPVEAAWQWYADAVPCSVFDLEGAEIVIQWPDGTRDRYVSGSSEAEPPF